MLLRNQFPNSTCEAKTAMDDVYERSCCVRGYHVYKAIWTASVGEPLICERVPENASDRYAVAVKKEGTIIGHLPRKVSRVCSLFLRRGGAIECTVTGCRRYSADLPQGGLEVPCSLLFKGSPEEIKKLMKLWKLSRKK